MLYYYRQLPKQLENKFCYGLQIGPERKNQADKYVPSMKKH